MRRSKTIMRQIFAPEDLKQFEGWEIRKINTSDYKPGIVFQNPDTGEKRKLLFAPSLFDGEYLKVIRGKGATNVHNGNT